MNFHCYGPTVRGSLRIHAKLACMHQRCNWQNIKFSQTFLRLCLRRQSQPVHSNTVYAQSSVCWLAATNRRSVLSLSHRKAKANLTWREELTADRSVVYKHAQKQPFGIKFNSEMPNHDRVTICLQQARCKSLLAGKMIFNPLREALADDGSRATQPYAQFCSCPAAAGGRKATDWCSIGRCGELTDCEIKSEIVR